jgi:transketolase
MKFNPIKLRKTVLDMAYAGSTVHIGCAFSIIELLSVLYKKHLCYPGNEPFDSRRDYFLLSKGHGVMAQYACMLELGWLSKGDILNYFSDGSNLKGLSDSRIPGIEVTSGSLGHGFSVGAGLALGSKLNQTHQKTYVLVGDGEINEGPIWEGALFASHHELSNFMVIVDENGFQAMGKTKNIMRLGSIQSKFESFGFDVMTVDGHDESAIDAAISALWNTDHKAPKALIASTIKGKGVDFMEHDNSWHYTRLNKETYQRAILSLNRGDI